MQRLILLSICLIGLVGGCKPRQKAEPPEPSANDNGVRTAAEPQQAGSPTAVVPTPTPPDREPPADGQTSSPLVPATQPGDGEPTDTQPAVQPNQYYTDQKAREILDKILEAHGGQDRLEALNKVKVVTEVKFRDIVSQMVRYEVEGKFRMDIVRDDKSLIQCHDGENFWIGTDEMMQAPPEIMLFLRREVLDGVFQQSLLNIAHNEQRRTIFHGKQTFEDTDCWQVETLDTHGRRVDLYFETDTYLLKGLITTDAIFKETELIQEYAVFQGVFYPAASELLNNSGVSFGTTRVLEVSSDFDETVFDGSETPDLEDEETQEEETERP